MSDDVIQVVIHPALRPALEQWLERRGLYLAGPLPLEGDDLPTFIVGVRDMPPDLERRTR
jgi:hypothetical protein